MYLPGLVWLGSRKTLLTQSLITNKPNSKFQSGKKTKSFYFPITKPTAALWAMDEAILAHHTSINTINSKSRIEKSVLVEPSLIVEIKKNRSCDDYY